MSTIVLSLLLVLLTGICLWLWFRNDGAGRSGPASITTATSDLIIELSATVERLKCRVQDLEIKANDSANRITILQGELALANSEVTALELLIREQASRITDLRQENDNLRRSMARVMRKTGAMIPIPIPNANFDAGFYNWADIGEVCVATNWVPWWKQGTQPGELHRPEFKPETMRFQGQKLFTTAATHQAGLYQCVPLVAGVRGLRFLVDCQYWSLHTDGKGGGLAMRCGLDPSGARSPGASGMARTTSQSGMVQPPKH